MCTCHATYQNQRESFPISLCHSKSQILSKIVIDKKIDQKVCKLVSNTLNKLSFVSLSEKVEGKVFFSFSFFCMYDTRDLILDGYNNKSS